MKILAKIALIVAILGVGFSLGTFWTLKTTKPVVETVYVRSAPKIVTVYDRILEPYPVIQEKIVTQKIPIAAKEWESLAQFETMFKGGSVALDDGVCIDVSRNIQRAALEQGYPVSVVFANNGWYAWKYVTDAPLGHAGVAIDVKGTWYFIDPIPWKVTEIYKEPRL